MASGKISNFKSIEFHISTQLLWKVSKIKIRSMLIEYSSARARKQKSPGKILQKDLFSLRFGVNASGNTKQLEEKKPLLQTSREHTLLVCMMFRSKVIWYEKGERNIDYFRKLYFYLSSTENWKSKMKMNFNVILRFKVNG